MISDEDKREIRSLLVIDLLLGGFLSSGCEIAEAIEDIDPEVLDEFFSGFGENEQKKKEMERKNGSR